jgi:hypothetical protein
MVRAAPSSDGAGPDSDVEDEFFAEFDRGMRNLPGELPWLVSEIGLHRASLVGSIGCSVWVGGASAFIVS